MWMLLLLVCELTEGEPGLELLLLFVSFSKWCEGEDDDGSCWFSLVLLALTLFDELANDAVDEVRWVVASIVKIAQEGSKIICFRLERIF